MNKMIKQYKEQRYLRRIANSQLPNPLVAYHVGPPFEGFSFKYLGTGEGNHILGPGLYFSDCKEIAKLYAKLWTNPVLYEVTLDTSAYYGKGQPVDLYEKLKNTVNELSHLPRNKKPKGLSPTGDFMADIIDRLGAVAAREKFVEIGVKGAWTTLPHNCKEIAVFDETTISNINSSYLTSNEYRTLLKPLMEERAKLVKEQDLADRDTEEGSILFWKLYDQLDVVDNKIKKLKTDYRV